MNRRIVLAFLFLAAIVTGVYWNHFHNSFHFDDGHTVTGNPWIRDVHNIPRFFTDAETSSTLPANRAWRPLVYTSLALDYYFGHGLKPLWFHISTFAWFLVLLACMLALFRKAFNLARPDSGGSVAGNFEVALFATAVFGLHPAIAETVNYIIQRADLYSTLGVVAALAVWALWPDRRRFGFYLIPLAAGMMCKPPALVFPVLLFFYVWLMERTDVKAAVRSVLPSLFTVGVFGWLSSAMTPASFNPGTTDGWAYRITQLPVILHYFGMFFLPTGLTADTDRALIEVFFDARVLAGLAFLIALLFVICKTARQREKAPIAFGLIWFLVACLPTSLFPLAELDNDHRMFFPFVGLTLSVAWGLAAGLNSRRFESAISSRRNRRDLAATACVLVLIACANGTRERNRVWLSEETLWHDVTLKSPRNGRGLMNYALYLMGKGDFSTALLYLNRALEYAPNYYTLEINLGITYGGLNNDAAAEQHFNRAIQIAPLEATPRYFYAVWLQKKGRVPEAISHLTTLLQNNPSYIDGAHLLMTLYATEGDAPALRKVCIDTLSRFPADVEAKGWLERASALRPNADVYLNVSLQLYQQRRYQESIDMARKALTLRPDSAAAWNNIAAASNELGKWDDGVAAATKAVSLNPDFQLAKNNLAWARQGKAKTAPKR